MLRDTFGMRTCIRCANSFESTNQAKNRKQPQGSFPIFGRNDRVTPPCSVIPSVCEPAFAARTASNRQTKQKIGNNHKGHFLFFGRNDRIRTCDIVLPKKSEPIFCLIYKAFRGFLVRKRCFRVLLFALFPRSPTL